MNIKASSFLILSLLVSLSARADNSTGEKSRSGGHIDTLVVAERVDRSRSAPAPTTAAPVSALVFDGGYTVGGDPIAGDQPPTAGQVATALSTALHSRGFNVAGATDNPAIVLTYHWGVLRLRHWRDLSLSHVNSNLKARLSLVANYEVARDLEQDILANRGSGGATRIQLDRPTYLDARQMAADPRFFVIVTAYDYASLKDQKIVPLWRTKLSALETSDFMNKAIPAMAAASGPYLGEQLSRPQTHRASLDQSAADGNEEAPSYTLSKETAGSLDQSFVGKLLQHEHDQFAGEDQQDWDEDHWGK